MCSSVTGCWLDFACAGLSSLMALALLGTLILLSIPLSLTFAAEPEPDSLEDYLDLPIENILSIDVVSLFKQTQQLKESASAVYIITQDDIRRSSATSIPELLRMVPGINVARISASKWAISSRGFNRLWSNKVLVMKDGQTLYDPLFAGVYWDMQDTILEDIDRIEVIRGPGASLWGSNAVNGVINIISKKASDIKGGLVTAEAGNRGQKRGAFRYAGKLNEEADMQVYAKHSRRGTSEQVDSIEAHDAWDSSKIGFSLDWQPDIKKEISVKAELYQAKFDRTTSISTFYPVPSTGLVDDNEDVEGGNFMLRLENELAGGDKISLQAYYDHAKRLSAVDDERDIIDFEFQHSFSASQTQELIWGIGYRYYSDKTQGHSSINFTPEDRKDDLYSLFIQDQLSFPEQNLSLIMGIRVEHNDYTGVEWQPNVRLSWVATENDTFWAAVSRAVHSPSRIEHDGRIVAVSSPYAPVISITGNDSVESETLIAYELGYRTTIGEDFFVDTTVFYNDYDNLLGGTNGNPLCQPTGSAPIYYTCPPPNSYLEIPINFASNMTGQTYGFEMAAEYYLTDSWTLKGSYSYLHMTLKSNIHSAQDEAKQGMNPQHQLSLRSLFDIRHDIQFDLWLRYMDELPVLDIKSYTTLDARLAWQVTKDVELSLVGQNLFDDSIHEFTAQEESIPATFNHRLIFGKIAIKF